jgi:hypothetical protein
VVRAITAALAAAAAALRAPVVYFGVVHLLRLPIVAVAAAAARVVRVSRPQVLLAATVA